MTHQAEPMTFGEKLGSALLILALMAAAIFANGCAPFGPASEPIGKSYKRAPMYWSYEANAWRTAPEVRAR